MYASPTALTSAQLHQLLTAADRSNPVGLRDYAMLLCLASLGLRAKEVAGLSLDDIDFAFGQRWIAHKGSIGHQIDLVEERFPPVRLNTDHAQIPLIRSLLVEMSWCLFQQKLCHTRSDGVHSGPHQHTPHHEASRIFIVWLTASR